MDSQLHAGCHDQIMSDNWTNQEFLLIKHLGFFFLRAEHQCGLSTVYKSKKTWVSPPCDAKQIPEKSFLRPFHSVVALFEPFCLTFPLFSSLSLTSRLVKTLLYNFIRQEKCPPPATHIFEPKDEGGLLYGLASGVASECTLHTQIRWIRTTYFLLF